MTRAHDSARDAFLGHTTAFYAPNALLSAIRHFPQRVLGKFLHAILPGHHLNQDYKDVVKL